MRRLALYPQPPDPLAIEEGSRAALDPQCQRCSLAGEARTPCMPAEGSPGGLLIVGEGPARQDDQAGRPFSGRTGAIVREAVARYWSGPVAFDNAVRCASKRSTEERHIDACRPFLSATYDEVRPRRVIAIGRGARAVTGRSVNTFALRGGYTYLLRSGVVPVPVWYVLSPGIAVRNRFVRAWFDDDLRHALTAPDPPLPPLDGVVRIVETEEDAAQAVAELRSAEWAALDVEAAGVLRTPSYRLTAVGLCAKGSDDAWVWPRAALRPGTRTRQLLTDYLADHRYRKIGANVKYDANAIELDLGVRPRAVRGDVRLDRKLLEPEAPAALALMAELVGMGGLKEEAQREMASVVERVELGLRTQRRLAKAAEEDAARLARGESQRKRSPLSSEARRSILYLEALEEHDPALAAVVRDPNVSQESWMYGLAAPDILLRYNARDAVAARRLKESFDPQIEAVPAYARTRRLLVEPAARAVQHIEQWGIQVNRYAIEAFDLALATTIEMRRAQIRGLVEGLVPDPDAWNPGSDKQVGRLLFETLKLPSTKTTDGGAPSVARDALTDLVALHPIVQPIIDYGHLGHLRSTYASGMLAHVRPNGRIHTSILLDGARSGRTSSADPNLQNIPRPTGADGWGKIARDCFVTAPGWTLIQFDYSQIELRIAAVLSEDEAMISIFREGVDFHQRTAELISEIAWGIPPSGVTKEHRTKAKAVNFGILYGKTARTLAREWGVSVAKAESVVGAILGRFRSLARWCEAQRLASRKTGEVWTWWDGAPARRRPLWRIGDPDEWVRSNAENSAVNTPIQGTASDFLIRSLAECVDWILQDGIEDRCRLILPVHDSLLFEVRDDYVDTCVPIVREIMTGWPARGVPLVVDEERGQRWGSLTSWRSP